MNKNVSLVGGLVATIAIGGALATTYIKMLDKIPVEYQALIVLGFIIILLEGMAVKDIAEYLEVPLTLLAFVPILRNYTLSEVVSCTDSDTIGNIKAPLITAILSVGFLITGYLLQPGKMKARVLVLAFILLAIHFVIRTICLMIVAKVLSTGMSYLLYIIIPLQPILLYRLKRTIMLYLVSQTDEEESDGDDYDNDDYDNDDYE